MSEKLEKQIIKAFTKIFLSDLRKAVNNGGTVNAELVQDEKTLEKIKKAKEIK